MSDVEPNPRSGAAGTLLQTASALRDLGVEVDEVWADDLPHQIRHGNLHYLLELPRAYRAVLRRRFAERRYDVVQVSQPHGFLAAEWLRRRAPEAVFIHKSHGLEARLERELEPWLAIHGTKRPPLRRLLSRGMSHLLGRSDRRIARHADGHIVSATECANFLTDVMRVPPKKVAVIPLGIAESYSIDPAPMTEERSRGMMYAGQFAFFKAPMIVAGTMRRLAARRTDLRFTWIAERRHHDQIRRLLGPAIAGRARLLEWRSEEELIREYDRHGLFLFPSFFEGFGKVFVEAMARGLCVVAADNGGAHDVIRHGVDGMRVPTGDEEAMERACLDLIDDPERMGGMSAAAMEATREYTWRRTAERCATFYRDRLDAKRAAS